ncbi:MAG TPA: hypothetical protein EYQ66_05455, partial [Myxococcales bacterium]|nr:hypothetical protein [Myxococcales bacterium]
MGQTALRVALFRLGWCPRWARCSGVWRRFRTKAWPGLLRTPRLRSRTRTSCTNCNSPRPRSTRCSAIPVRSPASKGAR